LKEQLLARNDYYLKNKNCRYILWKKNYAYDSTTGYCA